MALLLQAHVLFPASEGSEFDDVFDMIYDPGFVVVDDGDLSDGAWPLNHQTFEYEFSTQLFEERSDNLERVETLYDQLSDYYSDATVFKYREEHTFGESRSVSEPNAHIIITVVNRGVDRPRIRWRQELEPFAVAPRTASGRVYHATDGRVIALDGTSGDVLWTDDFEAVDRVPEARDDLVVASGTWSLRGYDGATGVQRWEITFGDQTEDQMLDSRVELGAENVYTGTRGGDVLTVDSTTGSQSVLRSFDDPIHQLTHTDNGLLVRTHGGAVHALESEGSIRWSADEQFVPEVVRDTVVYGTAQGAVQAISLEDGSEIWSIETGSPKDLTLSEQSLFVVAKDRLHRVSPETGELDWSYTPFEEDLINELHSAVSVSEELVLCLDTKSVAHLVRSDTGESVSTYALGGATQPPVSIDESVVLLTGPELLCLTDFPQV